MSNEEVVKVDDRKFELVEIKENRCLCDMDSFLMQRDGIDAEIAKLQQKRLEVQAVIDKGKAAGVEDKIIPSPIELPK